MDLDVAVIGASSSGLYAAELLARAGKRVAVFEREAGLASARRTMIVTSKLQETLSAVPDDLILHAVSIMRVQTPGACVDVGLRPPDLIIERVSLIRHLAQRAADAGAELRFGLRFHDMEPFEEGIRLHFNGHKEQQLTVTAEAVIGADGVFSDVATAARIGRPPYVPILQAEVSLPSGWDPGITKVWFGLDGERFFYWLIPESAERGVVGLAGDDTAVIRRLLQRFLQCHNLVPLAYQGAQVAMHHPRLRPWGRVGNAPVLLVGDAAGQVKVSTIGGSITGFAGAEAAARSLLNGTSYSRELRALKRELDAHWWIREFLERLDSKGYDELVSYVTPAVRDLLARKNRDEAIDLVWRLPLVQPRFMWLVGKALLGGRRFPELRPSSEEIQISTTLD